MTQTDQRRSESLRTLLIVLIGQVGCITLGIIIVSVLLGLWLDSILHTGHIVTLVLLFAGIPVSVVLMLGLARRMLARLQAEEEKRKGTTP